MAGSLSEFKTSFSGDLSRPNKFAVEIPIPIALAQYISTSRTIGFRCESAELPGRAISTTVQKTYGPEEKYPYLTNYNDVTLSFIMSDDMREKRFFDAWLEWINPSFSHSLNYKGDYCTPIRISQYDVTNRVSYSVDLIDAFPVGTNAMSLSWSSDGYHVLPVTFAYTRWRDNSLQTAAQGIFQRVLGEVFNDLDGNAFTSGLSASTLTPVPTLAPVRDAIGVSAVQVNPVAPQSVITGTDLPPL